MMIAKICDFHCRFCAHDGRTKDETRNKFLEKIATIRVLSS